MLLSGDNWGDASLWDVDTGYPVGPPLGGDIPLEDPILAVGFREKGKIAETFVGTHASNILSRWRIPQPIVGDIRRLILWIQVHTRMELDGIRPRLLDDAEREERRRRLEEMGGPPIT
jgi:hypothetical protein